MYTLRIPLLVLVALAMPAAAQPAFSPGDTVEASPTYSEAGWRSCVVVEAMKDGSYAVACGAEHVVNAAWIRSPAAPGTLRPAVNPRAQRPATSVCQAGAAVADRENQTGTVVQAVGRDCHVRLADGTVRRYLTWMLSRQP